jgi:hypothetical protein
MTQNGRTFYSKHMGVMEYADRAACIFKDANGNWEVDYWLGDKLMETVVMKTDGVYHNETYAENAAENYCLGYHR